MHSGGGVAYWIWVALGGAVGAVLRFGVAEWALARGLTSFPWATLAVNLAGSAALGFVTAWAAGPDALWTRQPGLRMFVTVGLLGALTTYSTFNLEAINLALAQRWAAAGAYLGATVVGALVAGVAGLALGRSVVG